MTEQHHPDTLAIVSLALGAGSFFIPFIGLLMGIAAIIIGGVALHRKVEGKGMAIAGVICGAANLIISIFAALFFFSILANIGASLGQMQTDMQPMVTFEKDFEGTNIGYNSGIISVTGQTYMQGDLEFTSVSKGFGDCENVRLIDSFVGTGSPRSILLKFSCETSDDTIIGGANVQYVHNGAPKSTELNFILEKFYLPE